MKKILYVALAALMLISCDPNAPKIPSKDNKTVDNLSKNVLSLLGEKKKVAVSTIEELGFQEVETTSLLPARLGLPAQKTEEFTTLSFFYGNVDVYEEAMEEEDMEILTDYLIEKKEILLMVNLEINESNKVSSVVVTTVAPSEVKNIHNLYAKFSKNVFLSLGDGKEWEGHLAECDDIDDTDAFEDFSSAKKRDKFDEAFAALESPFVSEAGTDELDDDATRTYGSQWIGDASIMSKDLDGIAVGSFQASLQIPETPEPEP